MRTVLVSALALLAVVALVVLLWPVRPTPPEAEQQEAGEPNQRWIDRLKEKTEDTAYAEALRRAARGDLRAVQLLAEMLRTDRDYYVRLGCATALGDLRASSAVPALTDALDDVDPLVRTAAKEALQRIGSQK